QLVDEAWRQFEFNNISATDMQQFLQNARQHEDEKAWREYQFNNMSATDRMQFEQNAQQFGEEMAWRRYEYNNMSASEKARLEANAEQFGLDMAWQKHRFEAEMAFKGGESGFSSGGGGGGNFSKYKITSGFGPRKSPTAGATSNHKGTDYGVPMNTSISATTGGKVIRAGSTSGFGNYVAVQDDNGYVHIYAHLNSVGVKNG